MHLSINNPDELQAYVALKSDTERRTFLAQFLLDPTVSVCEAVNVTKVTHEEKS